MRPERNRQSTRLRGHDYTRAGFYFVTICTDDRACLFGQIEDGVMRLNALGQLVLECWRGIETHFPGVQARDVVVMPNHVHGIIILDGARDERAPDARDERVLGVRDERAPGVRDERVTEVVDLPGRSGSSGLSSLTVGATHASPRPRLFTSSRGVELPGASGLPELPGLPGLPGPPGPSGLPGLPGLSSLTVGATPASPRPRLFTSSRDVPSVHDEDTPHDEPHRRPTGPAPASIGAIVGSFKSAASRRINVLRGTPAAPVWQRNYHDRILRNPGAILAVRRYILDNPRRWQLDREHPHARMSRIVGTWVLPRGAAPTTTRRSP